MNSSFRDSYLHKIRPSMRVPVKQVKKVKYFFSPWVSLNFGTETTVSVGPDITHGDWGILSRESENPDTWWCSD